MQEDTNIQNQDILVKEMLENGVQYGRAKRFTNSKMRDFLIKASKNVEIFDVAKTIQKLEEVIAFMSQLLSEDKTILFVGIQPAASEEIIKTAKILKQPYVGNKWVGGFLTNFSTIRTRVKFFEDLKSKKESGELDSYSAIEKSRVLRELQKMENIYGGVLSLVKLPDAIFTINLEYKPHKTMQREASIMGVPVIGMCGSDNNPDKFKIFVPANDKAPSSVKWILNYIVKKLTSKNDLEISEKLDIPNTESDNLMIEEFENNTPVDSEVIPIDAETIN